MAPSSHPNLADHPAIIVARETLARVDATPGDLVTEASQRTELRHVLERVLQVIDEQDAEL